MSTIPRKDIEAAIEALIAFLDLMDGDPDLEEGGDMEPSLAHLINGGCCESRVPDLEENEALAA